MINRCTLPALAAAAVLAVSSPTHAAASDPVVEISTPLGKIVVQLDPAAAPNTVANFLKYINDGDYEDSFVHRTARPSNSGLSVIQGGGFTIDSSNIFSAIPTDAPIANEFNQSNLRGTIAMARLNGDADSATSQWFINTTDNVALDTIDGGFTVFGNVVSGLDVADDIFNLTDVSISGTSFPFSNVPLLDTAAPPTVEQNEVVLTSFAIVPEPSSLALLGLGGLAMIRRRR